MSNDDIKKAVLDLIEKIDDTAILHRIFMILSRYYDRK